jgi:hypothetical protein
LQRPTTHAPDAQAAVALATAHARPHAPQLAVDERVSTSQPSAATPLQSAKPASQRPTTHAPPSHAAVALASAQVLPQRPQLVAAVSRLVSQPLVPLPSQSPKPAAQVKPHAPAVHAGVALAGDGHARPHTPQWLSDDVSTAHEPAQLVSPAAHVERHTPAEHTSPAAHARPHVPQAARSDCVLTSHPSAAMALQSAKPALQAKPQAPAAQVAVALAGAVHALPQRPQLVTSARVSDSHPLARMPSQLP